MSHPEEYDLVVLGSGRARSFAWSLASQGKRVAVVERRNLAGSCPTIACAPSKNVIHGAKVANYFRRGAEFGIAAGDWKVEMPAVRDRKRKMVEGIVARDVQGYRESGTELVMRKLSDEEMAESSGTDPLSPKPGHFPAKAKRVIFIFSNGGVSHMTSSAPLSR